MPSGPHTPQAIDLLLMGETPRVWSFVVSLFGDLAQGPGESLSGVVLTRLAAGAGVKPEAMRVALHRLKRDGWLVSARAGRLSHYRLSETGRAQSAAATPRIYATEGVPGGLWHVLVAGDAAGAAVLTDLAAEGAYVQAGPMVLAGPGPAPDTGGVLLAVEGQATALPDWLRDLVCPPDLVAACARLTAALTAAEALLPGETGPLDRAILRGLAVHGWRRLLLRTPALPDAAFPDSWQGPAARAALARLLARLPRPDLAEVEAEAQG